MFRLPSRKPATRYFPAVSMQLGRSNRAPYSILEKETCHVPVNENKMGEIWRDIG